MNIHDEIKRIGLFRPRKMEKGRVLYYVGAVEPKNINRVAIEKSGAIIYTKGTSFGNKLEVILDEHNIAGTLDEQKHATYCYVGARQLSEANLL